ncbi:MAG: HypC/HybG/HupF family hydrogenase formation chaperone [Halodesulfurarchaeum sp.]
MCLGIPGEIVEIDGQTARAEFWNVEKAVRLDIVGDDVDVGDYVLNHAGFAIRKIPDDEVAETMELYESLLTGDEDDALEEIGATDATLEFGDRPAALDENDRSVTSTDRTPRGPGDARSGPNGDESSPTPDSDE